jgi:hypothetical protein
MTHAEKLNSLFFLLSTFSVCRFARGKRTALSQLRQGPGWVYTSLFYPQTVRTISTEAPRTGTASYCTLQSRHKGVTFMVWCCLNWQSCTFSFVHPQSVQCCRGAPIGPKEDLRSPKIKQMTPITKKQKRKNCMKHLLDCGKSPVHPYTVLFFFLCQKTVRDLLSASFSFYAAQI